MELSIKTVVSSTMIVIVLVVLSFFITTQSGTQISASDASRIFNANCQNYKLGGCSWDVTKEQGFEEFLSACRELYGIESEAYSCLYVSCNACKKADISLTEGDGLRCAGICEQCRADVRLGIASTCCPQFASLCSASPVDCSDACPG